MDYSLLGPTGVKVSKICLGTATFGVAPDAQEAERVVHAALDLGINFFDTANVYGAIADLRPTGRAASRRTRTRRADPWPRARRSARRRGDRDQVR